MVHYIYKITCLKGTLKGHYYIGKHSTKNADWDYYGSGKIIRDYYKKYGRKQGQSIIKEILEYNPSFEENLKREMEIIGNLWETDPLCLNLCGGGRGPWGVKVSEETRQKLRKSHQGKKHTLEQRRKISEGNTGHIVTEETKEKISQANKGIRNGMYGKKPWNKGKKCEYSSGKNNYQSKPVNQYTLDGELIKTWDCASDAIKELNLGRGITKCCRGENKTAYGYKWEYAHF